MASTINNGIPLINGMLYSWADIVATINGVPLTGITGIEYGDSQDVVNKYGAGRHPVGRAKGRITPTAKIILYQEEWKLYSRSPRTVAYKTLLLSILRSPICPTAASSRRTKSATCSFRETAANGKRATRDRRWNSNSFRRISNGQNSSGF